MNADTLPRDTALVVLELKYLPSPRSPSLTIPCAVINTLAGFISAIEYKGCIILQQICITLLLRHYPTRFARNIQAKNVGISLTVVIMIQEFPELRIRRKS